MERGKHGTWSIVVTEMPYQVQKSRLIEQMAQLLEERKLRRSRTRAAGRPLCHAMRSRSRRRTTSSGTGVFGSLAISERSSDSLSATGSGPTNLRLREFVAKTMYGVQARGEMVFFFQTHPQAAHVYVDRAFVPVEVVAPHAFE